MIKQYHWYCSWLTPLCRTLAVSLLSFARWSLFLLWFLIVDGQIRLWATSASLCLNVNHFSSMTLFLNLDYTNKPTLCHLRATWKHFDVELLFVFDKRRNVAESVHPRSEVLFEGFVLFLLNLVQFPRIYCFFNFLDSEIFQIKVQFVHWSASLVHFPVYLVTEQSCVLVGAE